MLRKYLLEPLNGIGSGLEFDWDSDTGELQGKDAKVVRRFVEVAIRSGVALGHPYPTRYELKDPLHRPSELAVLLGNAFKLSPDLQAAYPACGEPSRSSAVIASSGSGLLKR